MLINSFVVFFRLHEPFEMSFYEITQDSFTHNFKAIFKYFTKTTGWVREGVSRLLSQERAFR